MLLVGQLCQGKGRHWRLINSNCRPCKLPHTWTRAPVIFRTQLPLIQRQLIRCCATPVHSSHSATTAAAAARASPPWLPVSLAGTATARPLPTIQIHVTTSDARLCRTPLPGSSARLAQRLLALHPASAARPGN